MEKTAGAFVVPCKPGGQKKERGKSKSRGGELKSNPGVREVVGDEKAEGGV